MRNLQRSRSHAPAPAANRGHEPNRRGWSEHPRLQLISDGVVAGYIHDISVRHGRGVVESRFARQRGDQA